MPAAGGWQDPSSPIFKFKIILLRTSLVRHHRDQENLQFPQNKVPFMFFVVSLIYFHLGIFYFKVWVDFFDDKDGGRRFTAVGCEDGELFVSLVDLGSSQIKVLLRLVNQTQLAQ